MPFLLFQYKIYSMTTYKLSTVTPKTTIYIYFYIYTQETIIPAVYIFQ